MRTLMWFTIGFVFSCITAAYDAMYPWLPPAAVIIVALGTALVCILRKRQLLRPALAVLTGCLAGMAWFAAYYFVWLQPLKTLDGQEISLTITASDYSYDTAYGIGVEGTAELAGKRYQVQTYINEEVSLTPGDTVKGTFRLRLTVPDDRTDSTYYQGKGIFLFAYQKGEITVQEGETPKWCLGAVLRHGILSILEELFPADVAPFVKALLLGYTSELDYATDTALKLSGIRHIVAVSGLHISILYGLVCTLTGRRRFLTALLGLPVLLLFAAVAGFTPSVTRASVMIALMILAQLFEREYDSATALSFAVLVMLLVNPLAVTSASLQLSAGCVAGILLFNGPINHWLKEKFPKQKGIASKIRGFFSSGMSVSLSAMSLVTPLSAAYFGTVSVVSILTNLLTLWAVNLVFNGLIVVCLLQLVAPGAAGLLAGLLAWPVRYVMGTAKLLASFPLAAVYTRSVYIVLWLVFAYILLAVFLLGRKKQPVVLTCGMVFGLCMALLASWAEPLSSDVRITMLDVGQGQSILLQSEGKTFLVDCGGDDEEQTADIVAETLLSQGIRKLDGIILTHYDRDHSGGLQYLLTRIGTDCLFLPDTRKEYAVPDHDGETVYIWEDVELTFGDARLHIYGPVYSGLSNENSLCVLFDTEKCDILITGDRSAFGERMLLRKRELPDVDILIAGHHGAADSTSEELLRAVTPEIVLISAAQDNIYGHPAPALLQRLAEFGCTVYRTDLNGTITIRR